MSIERRTRKRRRTGKKRVSRKIDISELDSTKVQMFRLVICISMFFIIFAAKIIMPEAMEKIDDKLSYIITGDVDYKAALRTIGEGIGGEKSLYDAMSEAYNYAFRISDDFDNIVNAGEEKILSESSDNGNNIDNGDVI